MPTLTYPNLGKPAIAWKPQDLFVYGAEGAWYDATDLSSLFQDAAGTIPVTALGDPVGRMSDKSGNGHHVSQAVAAARPTLARWPRGGRRNNFVWTEDFSQSRWSKSNAGDYTYGFPDPFGGNRATRWKPVFATDPGGSSRSSGLYQGTVGTPAKVRYSVYVKPVNPVSRYPSPSEGEADRDVLLQMRNQDNGAAWFNLNTMQQVSAQDSSFHATGISDVGGGWYRIWYTATGAVVGNSNTWLTFANRTYQTNFDPYPDGTEEVHIFGPMFEHGDQVDLDAPPPPYQKVTTADDVTEDGVPDVWHLSFDPADDVLTAPWTGFAPPAELAWIGLSSAVSGAGPAGLGIQYGTTARRFGTLASTTWIAGAPTAAGRDNIGAVGNLSSLAMYGVTATSAELAARKNGVVVGSKVPEPLGSGEWGTIRIGYAAGTTTRFFTGIMAFRDMDAALRSATNQYLVDRVGLSI